MLFLSEIKLKAIDKGTLDVKIVFMLGYLKLCQNSLFRQVMVQNDLILAC